ncbi:MAG TPA: hypothetical protein VF550_04870, partial [Polyangia bacterium]
MHRSGDSKKRAAGVCRGSPCRNLDSRGMPVRQAGGVAGGRRFWVSDVARACKIARVHRLGSV